MLSFCCRGIVVPHFDGARNRYRVGANSSHVRGLGHHKLAIGVIVHGPVRNPWDSGSLLISAKVWLVFEDIGATSHGVLRNPVNDVCHGLLRTIIVYLAWCNCQSKLLFSRRHDTTIWGQISMISVCHFLIRNHGHFVLTDIVETTCSERSQVRVRNTSRGSISPCKAEFEEIIVWERANKVAATVLFVHGLHVVLLIT